MGLTAIDKYDIIYKSQQTRLVFTILKKGRKALFVIRSGGDRIRTYESQQTGSVLGTAAITTMPLLQFT